VANTFKAPDLCQRIDPLAEGASGGFSERGFQVETLRSSCYSNLAIELHNPSLCDHVKPVRIQGLDGSRFDPAYCREHLFAPEIVVPDVYRMGPFVHFMQQAGLGDREVADFVYEHNPYHNPVYAVYRELREDPGFLARIHAARNYDEPESPANARPANALEFLYQMLAVDANNPALCAEISPNATFRKDGLLRASCHWDIAVNTRNAALCAQVPAFGAFPGVNRFYSREACDETMAVVKRPGFSEPGYYGPAFFPKPSLFQDALHQLGDDRHAVARPSPNDYWDFLSDLSYRKDSALRAEFLRRVRAMK
jgi:hypothetical protein